MRGWCCRASGQLCVYVCVCMYVCMCVCVCVLLTGALRGRCSACSDGRKVQPRGHRKLRTAPGCAACSRVPEQKIREPSHSTAGCGRTGSHSRTYIASPPRSSWIDMVLWDHFHQWTGKHLMAPGNLACECTSIDFEGAFQRNCTHL